MQDRISEILCMTHNLEYDPNLFQHGIAATKVKTRWCLANSYLNDVLSKS